MMDRYKELTAKGRDAYLGVMRSVSWFEYAGTPRAEIENRLSGTAPEDFLFCLYDLWFDTESFEEEDDYANLLRQIVDMAGLENAGVTVNYESAARTFDIVLSVGANIYRHTVPLEECGDWVDKELIDGFINEQVLPGEGIESRFLALPPCDQTVQFVFLPKAVYDAAMEKGIIPDDGLYFMSEK